MTFAAVAVVAYLLGRRGTKPLATACAAFCVGVAAYGVML